MGSQVETQVAVQIATLQESTPTDETLSPPRIHKWNAAVRPIISNSPRSARAIAIGIGEKESVKSLQLQMDTTHTLVLREVANLAMRFYGSPRGEKTMTGDIDMPKHVFIKWMKHDPANKPKTNLSAFRVFVADTTSQIRLAEASHQSEDKSTTHGVYHQSTLAKETIVQEVDSAVPVLEPLTAEAAIKVIEPAGLAGKVNIIVHEHRLDAVYQALRYVKRTDVIDECDKSAWAMVVLQLTGMDSIAGLENNRDSLRKVVESNSKKHENDEWCLRAKEFSRQYEQTQREKFFQSAISDGLVSDPSQVQQIIHSTPANSKERLQNVEKAVQSVQNSLQSVENSLQISQASSEWRFNAVIALGLIICGISLFRKPIR